MRGAFDAGFDDGAPEREIVPDGTHQCMIRYAKDDAAKRRTTIGFAPHGQYGLVFVGITDDDKGRKKAAALAAALGITAEEWAGIQPEDLLKRRLRIETRQWVRDDGTTACGTSSGSSRSTTSARAPAATAAATWSCPSVVRPGTQRNSVPGVTARES